MTEQDYFTDMLDTGEEVPTLSFIKFHRCSAAGVELPQPDYYGGRYKIPDLSGAVSFGPLEVKIIGASEATIKQSSND